MVDGENRNTAKLLSLIGLARKAGKITIGTEMVCDAVRSGDVKLVIASENSSDNTKKRISNCVLHYVVRLEYIAATPDELGRAIGKPATACVGIGDENFIKLISANL